MENIKVSTNFTNSCFYDENKKIRFDPPVYEQRYCTILRLLELDCWKDSFKKQAVPAGVEQMMSGDDFIYSAISNDNMNAFELNVIASTLASTDKLVRLNKQQKEDNDVLREKIKSLRESALQIKNLYEAEVAKVARAETQLASYVSQCKQLEERCLEADSDKINADLILMERLAENDRQHEENERRYQLFITDLIRYFSLPGDSTESGKKRELKQHLAVADALKLPDDVKAFIQQAPYHRSKRRKGRTKSATMKDQECQTSIKEMRNSSNNTDEVQPIRPEVRDCGTDALEETPLPQEPKEQPISKTFCDKATMHSMSTITRATCTSVFIKRVDVGVNFPEVTHKSVDEILRECVPLPPLLLTPISDILPMYESVSTQTDPPGSSVEKAPLVTCGTITNLKNIRKRIDYRGVEGGVSSYQQQYTSMAEQLFGKIKQEDYPSSSGFGFDTHDTFGSMHPHLSTIWRLLGESIFMLMNSGRRFDNQCYNMLNEQLATIRDMLEADGRRESELMSAMFSNVRATVVAAAGYGKERGTTSQTSNVVPCTEPPRSSVADGGSECPLSEEDCGVVVVEKEADTTVTVNQMCASATKEISNIDSVVLVEPESVSFSSPEQITPDKIVESRIDDEEVDRIEHQLQMMEEGEDDDSIVLPTKCVSETPVIFGGDAYNQQICDNPPKQATSQLENMFKASSVPEPESAGSLLATKDETLSPVPRPSTPPTVANVTSCYSPTNTATFVSPIKVKETNQLVKDQFKTPTQLPISKRKSRARRSVEPMLPHASKRMRFDTPPSSGRTSPTTEFLLEDDWDQKFSCIKALMIGPMEQVRSTPLSPIIDRFEECVDLELEKENNDVPETKQQEALATILSNSADNIVCMEHENNTVTNVIDRIAKANDSTERFTDPKDTKSSEESEPQQILEVSESTSEPNKRRLSEEGNTQKKSNETNISSEGNLLIESRPSEEANPEQEITAPTVTESVVENVPVNMDTSFNEDTVAKNDTMVLSNALEDGEIIDELNESTNSTNGELVIDIEPIPAEDCTVWDSPMSPPAHEMGLSVVTQPSCYIECVPDSPLSPPLPSDREASASAKPRQIPLFHPALHSQLRQQAHERKEPIYSFIALRNTKNGHEPIRNPTGQMNAQEKQVMQQLSEILKKYLQRPEWTEAAVNETITAVLNCTQDVRLMTLALLEMVSSCADITMNVLCSPPAPPLPLVQQKLILVVRHLGYGLEALEEVLMRELDKRMFQLKGKSLPLSELIALTFLYIGLEDSKPSEFPWKRKYNVRLYIFKCLYYFGFKGLPLVYYLLRAFPFALPKKGSPHYDNSDAMIATIRTILMNVNYTDNCVGSSESALFRKRELLWLLKNTYGYQQGSPTYEELVVNLVEKIRANKLRNVAHSLILVAKRNGFDWARLHIVQKRIYPLLNEYLKQFELMRAGTVPDTSCPVSVVGSSSSSSSEPLGSLDDRIVTCIFTIASIMKTQPSNEDASRVMQIFTTIVQLAEDNRSIQEEAIAGLIKFSRFGFVDVFQRLSSWNPSYPISDRIKLMLMTMVYRKPPIFWKQLMQNRIVIEHLHQPVLDKVPENVFGFIKPKVAMFSTPNAEYNVLFDGLYENGFRHLDHKFEWTRGQFEEWAESICQRYPDYCVKYFGIGPAPVGSEAVGCVSQMAVFVRHDFLDSLPPIVSTAATGEENVTVPNESTEADLQAQELAAPPNQQYVEVNGEILLVQPPTDDVESVAAEGEPAAGDRAMDNFVNVADDVVAEEMYREYNDIMDDIDDYGGDFDDEDDYEDGLMFEMHVPEEAARALRTRNDSGNFEEEDVTEPGREYWMVTSEVYPVAAPDNRSRERHIQDAAEYQLRRMRNFGDDFLAPEQDRYLIPLHVVHDCMEIDMASIEEVRQSLIRAGYNVGEDDIINLPLEDEEENDSDEERLYDEGGELDGVDEQYPSWDDNEEAKPSREVIAMTLDDCDETWD
uniref:Small RNA 2'-O-methyltransferase n=1 Tax=Anopheles culicifacies TaxID=139723 RepID=A0A182LT71_9DIPT